MGIVVNRGGRPVTVGNRSTYKEMPGMADDGRDSGELQGMGGDGRGP